MSQVALAILLFPAAGAILLAGRGWRLPRIVTKIVGPGVVWASFVATLYLFANSVSGDFTYWTWIKSGAFEVPFNLLVDNLSIFMCLVITGVGGLIVTYAVGYMAKEDGPSYARFFVYMDIFVFSMLLLVLAGNFIFLIVGWAMVGLSSYFLIGFWYVRHERHRRRGHDPRHVRAFRHVPRGDLRGSVRSHEFMPSRPSGVRPPSHCLRRYPPARACRLPAPRGRGRQVGAAAAPHVAPRRDGRPHPGQRPDSRRDDGHRRCLPRGTHASDL